MYCMGRDMRSNLYPVHCYDSSIMITPESASVYVNVVKRGHLGKTAVR